MVEDEQKRKELTLYEMLLSGAKDKSAPVFLYKKKTVSYRDFLYLVDRTAAALIRAGVNYGDVVVIALPNLPKAAALLYAINKIGAVVYLNHVLDTPAQIEKSVQKTDAKILFALDTSIQKFSGFCRKNKVRLISCCPTDELGAMVRFIYRRREKLTKERTDGAEDFNAFIRGAEIKVSDARRKNPFETSVLLNSGGTTGDPKTVEYSAAAINAECIALPNLVGKSSYLRTYMMSPLPIFHCFGLLIGLHVIITVGGCNVFMPRFSRKDSIFYLKKGKINFMLGVPAVYDALLSCAEFNGEILKGVEIAFIGGDFVRQATRTEFDRRMKAAGSLGKLCEGYGLSETLSVVCVNSYANYRDGSVGKPLEGARIQAVRTVEADAYLQSASKDWRAAFPKLPADAVLGELCVAGNMLMNGYYKDAPATEAVFFYDTSGTRWLKTGDIGAVDAEGFVYFLGRIKQIIKVSGESIFPIEIEALARTVAGVHDCAAFGIPDVRTGSQVFLAVEPKANTDTELLRAELQLILTAALQKNALPKEIVFYERLPKTKMQKTDVGQLVADNET